MHTNRRYELASLGLKVLVLLATMITIIGMAYSMGNLECALSRMSSNDTSTKGKQAAVQTALLVQKSGVNGGTISNSIQEKKGNEDVQNVLNDEVEEEARNIIKSEVEKKEETEDDREMTETEMTETEEEKEEIEEVTAESYHILFRPL